VFNPVTGTVVAPVRIAGKWTLAEDGGALWDRKFVQVWHQKFSPDGQKLAAIVAPAFGKWTVAVDQVPWSAVFTEMVTDLVFSPDGSRVAALGKNGSSWHVAVDGAVWRSASEMAWQPVFSPDGKDVAARVEKNGKYTVVVNDRLWERECDFVWDPAFSPDGTQLLFRSLEADQYFRRVVPVTEVSRYNPYQKGLFAQYPRWALISNPRNTAVCATQGIGFAGTSGLKFASALTLNQNPLFEIASNQGG
jgi:hypothetical protein